MVGSALEDFVDREDLSLGALGLELPAEVVPELGLGDDIVASEESDSVDFGAGVSLGGELASHDQVLPGFHLEG